jgi:hypothetical protein
MPVDRPRTAAVHAVHVRHTVVAHPAPVERARFDSRSARPASPIAAPAAALAASGGTIVYGAATRPRAPGAPGQAAGPGPAAPTGPAAPIGPAAIDATAAIELDGVDPAATAELGADVIAALIAETTKDLPARPAAAAVSASAALTLPRGSAAERTAPGLPAAAVDPTGLRHAPRAEPVGSPPRDSLTRIDPTGLRPAPPRDSLTRIDPASLWWSERPPLARSWSQTFAYPAPSRHRRRPPRVGLVVFFLIASLLCGILAPVCWAVASSELAGIELGVVANRHRGLLALALGWGVTASCLLCAAFLYLLWVIARAGALGT